MLRASSLLPDMSRGLCTYLGLVDMLRASSLLPDMSRGLWGWWRSICALKIKTIEVILSSYY